MAVRLSGYGEQPALPEFAIDLQSIRDMRFTRDLNRSGYGPR